MVLTALAVVGGYLLLRETGSGGLGRFTPPDPWCRLPSDDFVGASEVREIERGTYAVVVNKEPEALARLEQRASVELSSHEAEELVGHPLDGTDGRLVLLRALSWDTPYGAFTVTWRPGEVRVNHGCLGTQPLPVVRRALVARLPSLPAEVYVDLGMAE